MAIHVTHVASPSLAALETSTRRTVRGNPTTGKPAAKAAATAQPATATASFRSLLASSSSVETPAAAVATRAAVRSTAAATSGTAGLTTAASAATTTAGTGTAPSTPAAAPVNSTSATPAVTVPTAQSVFGPNVWLTDPTGLNPDGSSFGYNPIYFATESTAQTMAKMIGGTVFTENVFSGTGGAFQQQQPNYMIQMPNGVVVNPGLVASFYTFGFSQAQLNTWVSELAASGAVQAT